ncbi:MAG: hypothetical protein ACKVP3_15930 [Hyphomicrobiaceae bacterium]
MIRLALASAGAFLCGLMMGLTLDAQAQTRSVDNHGNWVVNFKSQTGAQSTQGNSPDRPRRRRSVRNKAPAQEKKDTLVRFADAEGRRYHPASKVWFDGRSSCWSGQEAFTFKKGAWHYGDAVWAQSGAAWSAAKGAQPELVSCDSDPAFAAEAKEYAATATTSSTTGTATTVTTTPRTGPEPQKAGAKTGCKKYFANVGQMLTVPCGD